MFVSSTSLIKWSTVVAGCLLLQQHHSVLVDGSRTRRVGETKDESCKSVLACTSEQLNYVRLLPYKFILYSIVLTVICMNGVIKLPLVL